MKSVCGKLALSGWKKKGHVVYRNPATKKDVPVTAYFQIWLKN